MTVLLLTFKRDRGENLARTLAEHGHDVTVDGVLLGRRGLVSKVMRSCMIVLRSWGRHDVVIAENPFWDAIVALALTMLQRNKTPLVYYTKGFAPASIAESGPRGLRRFCLWISRLILLKSDHVIFISDWLRIEYLQRMGSSVLAKKPCSVIHHAPAPDFLDAVGVDSRDSSTQHSRRCAVVSYAGNFALWDKSRGVLLLFEALARLAERLPETQLDCRIAGDGRHQHALVAAAARLGLADRVSFVGRIEGGALREFYRSSDIFVYPSFQDGCPTVVMEAQASGVPVIVTRSCGAAEVVEHGYSGIICEPTPDAVAESMETLLRDRELCAAMGVQARMHTMRHLSWAVCAGKMNEVISKYGLRKSLPEAVPEPVPAASHPVATR